MLAEYCNGDGGGRRSRQGRIDAYAMATQEEGQLLCRGVVDISRSDARGGDLGDWAKELIDNGGGVIAGGSSDGRQTTARGSDSASDMKQQFIEGSKYERQHTGERQRMTTH